jgi:hypothetical protein
MNPTAIYSKSGKGVQEASGKTSLLKRPDRAVLSAIDGRATLADVAQKVGKSFDADFQKLVIQMDKDGFIREVSPGAASAAARPAGPAAKAPPKAAAPSAPMDAASDLDFSSIAPAPKPAVRPAAPPPRPAAPPPRPAAPPVAKAPPPKEQQTALNQAREEAESKAAAERDRIKAETEAKVRAELEAKARTETEAKMKVEGELKAKSDSEAKVRADAEAKVKAARDAVVRTAAEAKVKAEAEARRVREEADKAKRESADLKQRLEEERKAREEAERKARDEGERGRKELEEERKRLEEKERKDEEERAARRKREEEEEKARRRQREEEERKADEERAARRKAEEEEEKARRKKKEEERKREEEEEERRAEEERAARRKKREEEEALARATEEEERRIRAEEAEAERQRRAAQEEDRRKSEAQKSIAEMGAKPAAPAKPAAGGGGFDSLLADLDSFGKKDEDEAKAKEETERKAKQDAARRAEEAARQEREEEERRASEERTARRKREAEEEERKAEEERAARRKKREEEDRREEEERKAEEKKRREKEEAAEAKKAKGKKAKASDDDIPVSDDDLGMDDVKRDQRAMAGKKKEKAYVAPPPVALSTRRHPTNWGKPVAIGLILLLAVAVGAVHVMPLGTAEYERAASEAIGRPVKIASGRMWLFTGLQLKLQGVSVGDNVKIANVTAFPTLDALSGDKKTFTRIDLDGVALPQEALAKALFAKVKGDKFTVARVVVKQLELTGPVPLPKGLEADIALDADGALRTITVRGPDTLVAKLSPKDSAIEFEVNAGGFIIPIAPEVTLGNFAMKGRATRQGMAVSEWDGALLNGTLRGTANLRWGSTWSVDGVMTARGMNAAVFAPALVSEGRGEGTAKFSMSGTDPAKLGSSGRYDGSFKIEAGALGNVDLSRAIRTGGRETAGRTEFSDMTGQATYDRGAVTLRNIQLSKGALNAGASADISREGALSGRIVADVRAGTQTLRSTLTMSGTAKAPQFKN